MRMHRVLLLTALAASSAFADEWQVVVDGITPTGQTVTIESLRYGTKTGTKPGVTELAFSRPVSPTTPLMLGRLQSQQAITKVTFTLTRVGVSAPIQVVTLSDVTVTAVQLTGNGTGVSETIFLRFNRLERLTNTFGVTGMVSGTTRLDWNILTGVAQ